MILKFTFLNVFFSFSFFFILQFHYPESGKQSKKAIHLHLNMGLALHKKIRSWTKP